MNIEPPAPATQYANLAFIETLKSSELTYFVIEANGRNAVDYTNAQLFVCKAYYKSTDGIPYLIKAYDVINRGHLHQYKALIKITLDSIEVKIKTNDDKIRFHFATPQYKISITLFNSENEAVAYMIEKMRVNVGRSPYEVSSAQIWPACRASSV